MVSGMNSTVNGDWLSAVSAVESWTKVLEKATENSLNQVPFTLPFFSLSPEIARVLRWVRTLHVDGLVGGPSGRDLARFWHPAAAEGRIGLRNHSGLVVASG